MSPRPISKSGSRTKKPSESRSESSHKYTSASKSSGGSRQKTRLEGSRQPGTFEPRQPTVLDQLLALALSGDGDALLILGDWIQEHSMPPYDIGAAYFFFMATRYILGRVVAVTPFEIVLESASWCPDTGRMYEALSSGNLYELEPFPTGKCIINRFAINDATDWTHELPTTPR